MPPSRPEIDRSKPLTAVIVGASGNLAQHKILPALFALFSQGLLPEDFHVVGIARSDYDDDSFREMTQGQLTCRYVPEHSCAEHMRNFLARCHYLSAESYDSTESFQALEQLLEKVEGDGAANRIFYLATPPFLFAPVARTMRERGLTHDNEKGYTRVVIEKPFGHDRPSSDQLAEELGEVLSEDQTYRIDHYLGKELVQNLLVLRFANQIFRPIWNAEHIQYVSVSFEENFGVEGRGGYFDKYGILRDVLQNHLLQILALVAMDCPRSLQAEDVRDAKVRVLRDIPALTMQDVVLGQYDSARRGGWVHPAYREEDKVPADSRTPTYAAALLRVENEHWRGTPFFLSAGKGLTRRASELRIGFRPVSQKVFDEVHHRIAPNELVVRIQPDEAVYLSIVNKVPGFGMQLDECRLDLSYGETFEQVMPEAYESLLLDVVRGDKSLFIRADELAAAWDVFTPMLHEYEASDQQPILYPFGSQGPDAARRLAEDNGVRFNGDTPRKANP